MQRELNSVCQICLSAHSQTLSTCCMCSGVRAPIPNITHTSGQLTLTCTYGHGSRCLTVGYNLSSALSRSQQCSTSQCPGLTGDSFKYLFGSGFHGSLKADNVLKSPSLLDNFPLLKILREMVSNSPLHGALRCAPQSASSRCQAGAQVDELIEHG